MLLLIDYGFPRREYYHAQRLMGTLMCHYRHHAHSDPFWQTGLNDVTAHVDFSAIGDAAHGAGLDVLGYTSQANFLMIDVRQPVRPLIEAMSKLNVQVGRAFPSLPNHMRVTIGKQDEMEAFMNAFRKVAVTPSATTNA